MMDVEVNVPVLIIRGTIVLSLQIDLNDRMVESIQKEVLRLVETRDVKRLVIDVSGLDVIDSYLTRMLVSTLKMASLMGVKAFLAGIKPYVALTLVDMGLERLRLADVEIVSSIEDVVG